MLKIQEENSRNSANGSMPNKTPNYSTPTGMEL